MIDKWWITIVRPGVFFISKDIVDDVGENSHEGEVSPLTKFNNQKSCDRKDQPEVYDIHKAVSRFKVGKDHHEIKISHGLKIKNLDHWLYKTEDREDGKD